MTPKMVSNFRRSLSFPNNPSSSSTKPPKTYHLRSTSLPCTSHPLISQLKDHLNHLKSHVSNPANRNSAWLCDGLTRLKTVHDYLDDILHLPQTQDSLRRQHSEWDVEKLLEDFLRFVDVYGTFQTLVLALKQEQSAAQVAIRRRDDSKVESYVKATRKLAKEMGKIVSTVRAIGSCSNLMCNADDVELAEVITDVKEVTVSVSVALFNGISLPFGWRKSSSWVGLRFAKKGRRVEEGIEEFRQEYLLGLRRKGDHHEEVRKMVLKRMHELEDCIAGIENGSERVFRSLINTRVSLLNILTK